MLSNEQKIKLAEVVDKYLLEDAGGVLRCQPYYTPWNPAENCQQFEEVLFAFTNYGDGDYWIELDMSLDLVRFDLYKGNNRIHTSKEGVWRKDYKAEVLKAILKALEGE